MAQCFSYWLRNLGDICIDRKTIRVLFLLIPAIKDGAHTESKLVTALQKVCVSFKVYTSYYFTQRKPFQRKRLASSPLTSLKTK